MKELTKLICIISILLINLVAYGQTNCGLETIIISENKDPEWNLPEAIVLQDSFNEIEINQNIWGFGFPWGKMLNEEALEGMAEENLEIIDGELVIKTEYRPREFDRFIFNSQGELIGTEPVLKDYSSAGIYSKVNFTKGIFEMDYSIEEITGQWPAFWLLGDCQQEIDIFEYFYGKSILHDNWTKEITYTLHQDSECINPDKCMLVKTRHLDDNFYLQPIKSSLNWESSRLRFYNNSSDPDFIHYRWRDLSYRPIAYPKEGDVVYQSSYFPFDKPMTLLIGQGVHKNIDHKLKNKPRFLKVKNVTVWQKLDPSGKHLLNNNYNYEQDYDGIVTGSEVIISDTSPYLFNNYLIVRVVNHAILEPGFDSKNNLLDIKAIGASELRFPPDAEALSITPQNIVKLEFFDFQGELYLEIGGLNRPIHEKEIIIEDVLKNSEQKLNGIYILRTHYSDGSVDSEKIGFVSR